MEWRSNCIAVSFSAVGGKERKKMGSRGELIQKFGQQALLYGIPGAREKC